MQEGILSQKKKKTARDLTHAFCFCREVRTYAEGSEGELSQEGKLEKGRGENTGSC